jgi:hypothetical protein
MSRLISRKNMRSVKRLYFWLEENPQAKVVKFKASSTELRQLFDKDCHAFYEAGVVANLSMLIDRFKQVPADIVEEFITSTRNEDWYKWNNEDYYACYQMLKILWLDRDIKKNGQQAPVQIIKTIESYHCHPGSDKKYAMTLLNPLDSIDCFYIWYPQLDPDPWFNIIDYQEVKTPEEFVDMFSMADHKTFYFEHGTVDFHETGYDTDVEHFRPMADAASDLLLKIAKREGVKAPVFSVDHLSYRDSVHRHQMEQVTDLLRQVYFINDEHFRMGEYDFSWDDKLKIWIPDFKTTFPKSLWDPDYQGESFFKFRMDVKK